MFAHRIVMILEGRRFAALVCLWLLTGLSAANGQTPEPTVLQMVAWQHPGERTLSGTVDLLARFHETNPRLRLNLTHDQWGQALPRMRYWCGSLQRFAPDLTVLPDVWLWQFADSLQPLDDYFKPRDLANISPAALDRCRVDGKLLGVPWLTRSRVLYYRRDLFEQARLKPPQTLEALREAALALKGAPGLHALGLPAAAGGGGVDAYWGLLTGHGGANLGEDGEVDLQAPEAVKALEYWLGLQQAGLTQPEALTWEAAELDEAFAQGKLAMVFSGPALGRYLRTAHPELQFGVCPLPGLKQPQAQVSAEVMVVFKSTTKLQQCGDFARFMISAEAQRAMWLMGGLPTYRQHLSEASRDSALAPFVAHLDNARGLPLKEPAVLGRIVERALWLALSGRADAAGALKDAVAEEQQRLF